MEKLTLTVTEPLRADVFLAQNANITRSRAKKLCDSGLALLNFVPVKASQRLCEGDTVVLTLPPPEELCAKAEDIALDVVYEDSDVIVINKPRGMVVHAGAGNADGTVVNALLAHCKGTLSGINGVLRPGIVHRIDKDTTGLLIAAKNDIAHASLASQLASRTLSRSYLALVHGNFQEDSGTVDAPLSRSEKDRKMQAVRAGGREAITDYEVRRRYGTVYTLLECRLRTGRTHQIRVHMKHISHPIVGDRTYGVKKEEFSLPGQLLHAAKIMFIHPSSGESMLFGAPLPEDFQRVLDICDKKYEGT